MPETPNQQISCEKRTRCKQIFLRIRPLRRANPHQNIIISCRLVFNPSTSSKTTSHLLLHVLGALFLDDWQGIVFEHAHGLPLPLRLSGLARLAYISAAPTAVIIVISTPPVAVSVVVARVATRLAVEHVVVLVLVAVIAASPIVTGPVSAVAIFVIGVSVFASAVGFVALGLVAIAVTAAIVSGLAGRIVFVV
jgi:hypothetical protein